MTQTKIPWNNGEGFILASYDGNGNGLLRFSSSDPNEGIDRSQRVQVASIEAPLSVDVTVSQIGLREEFCTSDAGDPQFETKDGLLFAVIKSQTLKP